MVFDVAVFEELGLEGDGGCGVAVAERPFPRDDAGAFVRDGEPDAGDVEVGPAARREESVGALKRRVDRDVRVDGNLRQFLDGDARCRGADGDRAVGVDPDGVFEVEPFAGKAVRIDVVEPEAVVMCASPDDAFGLPCALRHREVVNLVCCEG